MRASLKTQLKSRYPACVDIYTHVRRHSVFPFRNKHFLFQFLLIPSNCQNSDLFILYSKVGYRPKRLVIAFDVIYGEKYLYIVVANVVVPSKIFGISYGFFKIFGQDLD